MWGKEISETHQMIVDEHGNQTSQYYIGPAGENLVRYRGGHDRVVPGGGARRPGRGDGVEEPQGHRLQGHGPGAGGGRPEEAARADGWAARTMPLIRPAADRVRHGRRHLPHRQSPAARNRSGTGSRNGTTTTRSTAEYFAADQWVRRYWADYGCTVACSKLGRVKYGKRAGSITELPDYEAGALEGTNFGIFDIDEMAVTTRPARRAGLRPDQPRQRLRLRVRGAGEGHPHGRRPRRDRS